MDLRAVYSWSAGCVLLLCGCSAAERGSADHFVATGELVALSGGDGGAAYACVACHGLDGRGDGAGAPRLAGLDRGYMTAQLEAYADGRRQHPEMQAAARKLTAPQRDAVSDYFARLPFAPAGTAARNADGAAYRLYHHGDPARRLPACAECHGQGGEGAGPANPPLAGQPASYLAGQIEQWRRSARRNDPGNVMLDISQRLTPREAAALAEYAASLRAGPPRPESAAASREERRGDPRSDASAPPPHEGGS